MSARLGTQHHLLTCAQDMCILKRLCLTFLQYSEKFILINYTIFVDVSRLDHLPDLLIRHILAKLTGHLLDRDDRLLNIYTAQRAFKLATDCTPASDY